tara:strand:+ start:136 stop:393 length:258 start_codon:yes stop_codon:yes gene_type:complete
MRPVNRRLLVELYEEKEEAPAFILPDNFQEKSHRSYKILATANDCSMDLKVGEVVVAHTSDPEKIVFEGNEHLLLLENRVVCVVD